MFSLLVDDRVYSQTRAALTVVEREYLDLFFREGKVDIFYSFDREKTVYEAVSGSLYGSCLIGVDGTLRFTGPLAHPLFLYVRESDASADESVLSSRYGSDYPVMKSIVAYGPGGAKRFLELSKKVENLTASLSHIGESTTSMTPHIQFCLESKRGRYEVYCRVGFTKLHIERKMGHFLADYFAGRVLSIQKQFVSLPKKSFSPAIEEALQYLFTIAASNGYFYGSQPITLSPEHLVDFFFLLQGESVDLDKTLKAIRHEENVALSLGEDGMLSSTLPLTTKNLVRSGDRAYVLSPGEIFLYRFPSIAAGEIFSFYQKVHKVDLPVLSSELARNVFPLVSEKEISIAPEFEAKHPIHRPRIRYYIGLEDGRTLGFHTEYYLASTALDEESFLGASALARRNHAQFEAELERLGLPKDGRLQGDEQVFRFLRNDLTDLQKACQVYISEELAKQKVAPIPEFGLHSSSGEDWLSIHLFSSGYTEEELLELFTAYKKKKRFVKLQGTFIALDDLDEKDQEKLDLLAENFEPEDFGIELPLYQALKLPAIEGEVDEAVGELIHKVEDYDAAELLALPEPIQEAARPYQLMGIRFLSNLNRLGLSGVLSDDMGLGKTLQSFGLFAEITEEKPILVVCPKSLIYNWLDEKKKWYPELEAHVLVGSPKERKALYLKMREPKKACYFVSYDTLRNDIALAKDISFAAVILDEGQYIANAAALKTKAVKSLEATSRFVLTGTPVQNSLTDIWSIFDFLLPGYFPPLTRFKEQYGGLEVVSEEARGRLLAKIKPFLLGRKKKDVLSELPDKENISIAVAMADEQRAVYESYLVKARQALEEGDDKITFLAMMTRLRQICVSPALFLEGEFPSSKVDYLISSLSELKRGGRKALVFSSFVGALDMVRRACEKEGIVTETIQGSTSAKVRLILANRFNDPDSDIDVMLVSLKAGGTGLNLIGADTVFHLDPWWNLAAERQAEDRAHRIGQQSKVTVFKLVSKDSIEERVLSLQQRKGLLIDITDEASLSTSLTEEDYRFLLS